MLVSYDCQHGNGFTGVLGDDGEFALPINKKAFADMGEEQYSHEGESYADELTGQKIHGVYLTKAEYQKLVDNRKGNEGNMFYRLLLTFSYYTVHETAVCIGLCE